MADFDPVHPPPLTNEQEAELRSLAERTDEEIDTSDIPPLDSEFWKQAARNPHFRPTKKQLTVRLDSDVLAWLRARGGRYQTKLNAILRQAMLRELDKR